MTPNDFLHQLGTTAREVSRNVPRGIRHDSTCCPVARALARRFRRGSWCAYQGIAVRYKGREVLNVYELPAAVRYFVIKFDGGDYPELVSPR